MRCISPLCIRVKGQLITVPCGKCNFCLQAKRADWTFRLMQEEKVSKSGFFVSMTYADEHLVYGDGGPTLCKADFQLFFKKLRNSQPKGLRYFAVGEYGSKYGRPHFHMLLFNAVYRDILFAARDIERIWQKGHVDVGDIEPASIHYVAKYVINRPGDYSGRVAPFCLMSRRNGIGFNYMDKRSWHRHAMRNYVSVNGVKSRLPRYFKDKFFSVDEKAALAAESLILADQVVQDRIAELAPFHSDPAWYYEERLRSRHESIFSKVNSTNLF